MLKDRFYFFVGIIFLALAKGKNLLKGYATPKPYDISELERCIDYDLKVVDKWLTYLKHYTNDESFLSGKNVLELGPGSDLGVGIYLLYLGAAKYNACDVNNLAYKTPDRFYQLLFDQLKNIGKNKYVKLIEDEYKKSKRGEHSLLNYVVRNDFNIADEFKKESVDIVFSQAAFEHFDNIEAVIDQLSIVCKPGAVIVALIDLKTHSRWIREKDPNNIYRYKDKIYNIFYFRGIPNRVRPFQYKEAFERSGWTDISIIPRSTLKGDKLNSSGFCKKFTDGKNQMSYLSVMLCARKKT